MGRTGLEGRFGGFQSTRLNNEEQLRDFKQQRTKSYLCFRKTILENAEEMDKKRGWQSG